MRICLFGLGEAGSEIGRDLADSGARVSGFDPGEVDTPAGVVRFTDPTAAVADAEVVIALTAASDSERALAQALERIPPRALYADFSTASPGTKRDLAVVATHAGLSFTDVALMAPVPGKGVRTPALGSGPDARTFAERMLPFGMEVTVVGLEPGEAATHKLLRSVVVKGLAAVVIESIEAARAAGLADSTWENVVAQITSADEGFLRRIIEGTGTHAQRRRHEMAAAAELLESLGVDPVMTRSTVAGLDRVLLEGIPPLPADG